MQDRSTSTLYIIGLGVSLPDHITPEATRAMSQCSRLYSIVQAPQRLWLPPGTLGKVEVVDAFQMYAEDRPRIQNYEHVARTIFQALDTCGSVGYVTYGNPMSYDCVAQNLVQYAKKSGSAMRIIPGISSIDTVLCDLGVDLAPGLQVYEATWLVACGIRPHLEAAALLVQMGTFGSLLTNYQKRPTGASLAKLVIYLREFYPATHEVFLVRSSSGGRQPPRIRRIELGNLCAAASDDLAGASMYIPAVRQARFDDALVEGMETGIETGARA
jgi:precorrin-3B methylase